MVAGKNLSTSYGLLASRDDRSLSVPRFALFPISRAISCRPFHTSRALESAAVAAARKIAQENVDRGRDQVEEAIEALGNVPAQSHLADAPRDNQIPANKDPNEILFWNPRDSSTDEPQPSRPEKVGKATPSNKPIGRRISHRNFKAKFARRTRETKLELELPTPKRDEVDDEDAAHPPPMKVLEHWQLQKKALKKKFPEGWNPRKKLSPDAVAGIKALHRQFPDLCTTSALADKFEISPEAIRRILKSKWTPAPEEEENRQRRWNERGKVIWARNAELGMKPPVKWRKQGITRDPSFHERRRTKRAYVERVAAAARFPSLKRSNSAGKIMRLQRRMGQNVP